MKVSNVIILTIVMVLTIIILGTFIDALKFAFYLTLLQCFGS